MNWTDDELITACIRGDIRAWNEFVSRFGKLAYGTAYRVLSRYGLSQRHDLLDDIYQHVFTECWEKKRLESLRKPHRLRSLIVSLTVSRSVDTLRGVFRSMRRSPAEGVSLEDVQTSSGQMASAETDPASEARRHEIETVIDSELKDLPAKEALILRMNVQYELTHQEISELLGIPKDTVSTVIRRARHRIKDSLERKGLADL